MNSIAGGTGGVYRSTDNGSTWNSSGLIMFRVEAIAISSTGIILAATGAGIYRSPDNGTNWTYTGLFLFSGAVSLVFGSSGYAFAGAGNDTLFRSTDNGNSWIITAFTNSYIKSLLAQPDGDILAGAVGGLFRSTDNGANWSQVGLNNIQILSLAMNSDGHIFAGTGVSGVYRSTDNGNTWEQINTGLTNLTIFAMAINGQGYIFAGNGTGVFRSVQSTTSVEEIGNDVPTNFALEQNYPNPFNPSTTIQFSLPRSSFITLRIFNLLGEQVATLVSQDLPAGNYSTTWNPSDVASGVYLYQLQVGKFISSRKLVLLR